MRWTLIFLLGTSCVLVEQASSFAQPIFRRVERRVRNQTGGSQNRDTRRPLESPAAPGYLGLIGSDQQDAGRGVRISSVAPGSAAERSGLQPGDLITSIDGQRIRATDDVAVALEGRRQGDRVDVTVERGRGQSWFGVILGSPTRVPRAPRAEELPDPATAPRQVRQPRPLPPPPTNLAPRLPSSEPPSADSDSAPRQAQQPPPPTQDLPEPQQPPRQRVATVRPPASRPPAAAPQPRDQAQDATRPPLPVPQTLSQPSSPAPRSLPATPRELPPKPPIAQSAPQQQRPAQPSVSSASPVASPEQPPAPQELPSPEPSAPPPAPPAPDQPPARHRLGVNTIAVSDDVQRINKLPDTSGALVVLVVPGLPAERAGIPLGAIIRAVDDREVLVNEDLSAMIRRHRPGDLEIAYVFQGTATRTKTRLGDASEEPRIAPAAAGPKISAKTSTRRPAEKSVVRLPGVDPVALLLAAEFDLPVDNNTPVPQQVQDPIVPPTDAADAVEPDGDEAVELNDRIKKLEERLERIRKMLSAEQSRGAATPQ